MGLKTRLSSHCTKRANNGVNLVTSRKVKTRLARPIHKHKVNLSLCVPCTPKALSLGVERQILGVKLTHCLSICGMHTASDSTRRSRNTMRWFRTCANILLYAHQARRDLRGANLTLSVCRGHRLPVDNLKFQTNALNTPNA